ncbi:hypothetical protein Godav_005186 [Gossypium davidsonii]|uniref:DUF4283 domain-containing protein n=1 Tax=Gossypium davidsonii TaxID=34287 RepID=A0A7J8TB60_GOSDV|nr:hypothetical protein [Gossypium davidsonii]
MSFKDKLLRGDVASSDGNLEGIFGKNESDFELLEGDVNMSMVNGIPAISFSNRINDILFKEMELTIILKLLRRNIGYNGPWIIFRQYLTVQPWTKMFNLVQPYPSMVMAWIHLPDFPGYLYKRKIIEAIGELIKKVVKLDLQTDNRTKGRFAHLAVFINLYQGDVVLSCGDLYRIFGLLYVRNSFDQLEMGAILTVGRILGFLMLGLYTKR